MAGLERLGVHYRIMVGLSLWAMLGAAGTAWAQDRVRIATYNIKFLKSGLSASNPDRLQRLRDTIETLDADVIGLQEINDRAALLQLFPAASWSVVIDDQSNDDQDIAVAVRKPLTVVKPADLEADPEDFLCPNTALDSLFPDQRDVLCVTVRQPAANGSAAVDFIVMSVHAKARAGGRATTDPRRVGAAVEMIRALEQQHDDDRYVLLGDFNDTPDDRSMNILETGNPTAPFLMEQNDDTFLLNLMEPLWAAGNVSHGRNSSDINDATQRINTVDPLARQRNADHLQDDSDTGDILFDQILIPVRMRQTYVLGSAKVFDGASAAIGNSNTRASDHLPVYAEFVFVSPTPSPAPSIKIVALLPNPAGPDANHETVTLRNTTVQAIDLTGWKLCDRSGNEFSLSGTIAASSERVVTLSPNSMPLNNDGDDVVVLNSLGAEIARVTYDSVHVSDGVTIHVP